MIKSRRNFPVFVGGSIVVELSPFQAQTKNSPLGLHLGGSSLKCTKASCI